MADAYEAEKNEEIETLEESISSTQKIYEMAIAYIDECWDTLYTDLMEWNYEYGTVTSDEIQSAWDAASTAVESYGSYLEAVLATTEAIADVTAQIEAIESGTTTTVSYSSTSTDEETGETTSSYDTSGGEYTAAAQSIVAQMKANAAAWWETDESGQTALAEENEELAEQLSSIIGREVVKDGNGVWHLDSTSGAVLFETEPFASYHTGGIVSVDDSALKDDEVFAKLQEGEAVFTTAQIESLEHILDMIDMIPKMTDAIDSLYANTIASNSIMDGLTQASGNYENIVTDNSSSISVAPVITIEYTGSGTTEEEFTALSQTLSDTVITNINNAFAKKGKLPLAKGLKA